MSNFLNLLAKSNLVPTPSVQETIIGSLILSLLISYNDPNDPILLNFPPFLTLLPVIVLICFTNLFPRAMFTPLSL